MKKRLFLLALVFFSLGKFLSAQVVLNTGFELSGNWTRSGTFYYGGVTNNPHGGANYAYTTDVGGNPQNNLSGALKQCVTIPAGSATATLSIWISITTEEAVGGSSDDQLLVRTGPCNNTNVTLATFNENSAIADRSLPISGVNCACNYSNFTYNMTPYIGQSVDVEFVVVTNGSNKTVFRIDDVDIITTQPAGPAIVLSDPSLNFGTPQVGLNSVRTLTISNPGSATLNVTSINLPAVYVPSLNSFSVPANGGSQPITITFTPAAAISYNAPLLVNSNAPGSPHSVSLIGSGTNLPTPGISLPSSLSFGNIPLGSSTTQTLSITNSGNAVLNVGNISYPSGYSDAVSNLVINPGSSQNITVTFTPTQQISYNGSINIPSNAPGSPHSVSVIGSGVFGPVPSLVVQNSMNFGPILANTTSTANLLIQNLGQAPLAISSVSATGAFSVTPFNGTLPSGATALLPITFSPTQPIAYGGSLTINSNDLTSPHVVSLVGTAGAPLSISGTIQNVSVIGSNLTSSNFQGATITLLTGNTVVATTISNPNGYFSFGNISSNINYRLIAQTNTQWSITLEQSGIQAGAILDLKIPQGLMTSCRLYSSWLQSLQIHLSEIPNYFLPVQGYDVALLNNILSQHSYIIGNPEIVIEKLARIWLTEKYTYNYFNLAAKLIDKTAIEILNVAKIELALRLLTIKMEEHLIPVAWIIQTVNNISNHQSFCNTYIDQGFLPNNQIDQDPKSIIKATIRESIEELSLNPLLDYTINLLYKRLNITIANPYINKTQLNFNSTILAINSSSQFQYSFNTAATNSEQDYQNSQSMNQTQLNLMNTLSISGSLVNAFNHITELIDNLDVIGSLHQGFVGSLSGALGFSGNAIDAGSLSMGLLSIRARRLNLLSIYEDRILRQSLQHKSHGPLTQSPLSLGFLDSAIYNYNAKVLAVEAYAQFGNCYGLNIEVENLPGMTNDLNMAIDAACQPIFGASSVAIDSINGFQATFEQQLCRNISKNYFKRSELHLRILKFNLDSSTTNADTLINLCQEIRGLNNSLHPIFESFYNLISTFPRPAHIASRGIEIPREIFYWDTQPCKIVLENYGGSVAYNVFAKLFSDAGFSLVPDSIWLGDILDGERDSLEFTISAPGGDSIGKIFVSLHNSNEISFAGIGTAIKATATVPAIVPELETNLSLTVYPNPAKQVFNIEWEATTSEQFSISLFDTQGRKIEDLYIGNPDPGIQKIEVPVGNLSSGTYILRLSTGSNSAERKIIIER